MPRHRLLKLGEADYSAVLTALFGPSLIGYWKGAEPSGSVALDSSGNGRNGAYTAVTLAQPGIGDGLSSVKYDGTTSFNNIFGASLAAAFNNQELSVLIWYQVRAASVLTDATQRGLVRFVADGSNLVNVIRTTTNNQFQVLYAAGGVSKSVLITDASTNWQHLALTISKSNDRVRAYLNGVQSGATQTGLGVWAGALTSAFIGAATAAPTQVWDGQLAHVALLNREATANEVAAVALQGGA